MASKYTVKINGLDITTLIDASTYETARIPVFGPSVTTMDGVEHTVVIRSRGQVAFGFNPMVDTRAAELAQAFAPAIVRVEYHCMQRNEDVVANMRMDGISAKNLSQVRLGGRKWHELESITLTEM